ncbi:peroxiredoxin [Enteractinococcus coprophilus]
MVVPALRDQYGQDWPFPPVEGPDQPGHDTTWLIFIPGAYTPVCMSELEEVGDLARQLTDMDVGLRLIAPDSAQVLRMVTDQLGLEVPFLSDFWPHGAAAKYYGVLDETTGRPKRVSLLVDRAGTVLEAISSTSGARKMDEHLSVLQKKT